MRKIEIETLSERNEPGHYTSDAIVIVEGADRSYGPGGWAVGGWTKEAEGRIVDGGPMVRGPHAYLYGRCGVIDTRGGTGAEHARAADQGRLHHVADGDVLVIDGVEWRIKIRHPLARIPELKRVS